MYLSFYRLHSAPFSITPDPAFLYWTPDHQEAYASLLHGVESQKGFICLCGQVGCGKTTVLRSYLDQLDRDHVKAVYLINPEQTFDEVLRAMGKELGLTLPDGTTSEAVEALHEYLLERHQAGERVVLLVDEAQRMPAETIERLRILSNLETAKAKLLQIVLCGQRELDTLLAQDNLRQIRERIAVRAQFKPLAPAQAAGYIRHRVECAGGQADRLFTRSALKEIVRQTKGNPRLINVLCENALIGGFAKRERAVSARTVREALDVFGERPTPRAVGRLAWVAAAVCVLIAALAVVVMNKDMLPLAEGSVRVVEQPPVPSPEEAPVPEPAAQPAPAWSPPPQPARLESAPQSEHFSAPAEVAQAEPPTPAEAALKNAEAALSLLKTNPAPAAAAKTDLPQSSVPMPEARDGRAGAANAYAPVVSLGAMYGVPVLQIGGGEELHSDAPTVWVTVAPGDTLDKLIRSANGVSTPRLVRRTLALNPELANPALIHPGQEIAIPWTASERTGEPIVSNSAPEARF